MKHSEVWDLAIEAAAQITRIALEEVHHKMTEPEEAILIAHKAINELHGNWGREIKDRRKVWRLMEADHPKP
jgi:hypothetical protein